MVRVPGPGHLGLVDRPVEREGDGRPVDLSAFELRVRVVVFDEDIVRAPEVGVDSRAVPRVRRVVDPGVDEELLAAFGQLVLDGLQRQRELLERRGHGQGEVGLRAGERQHVERPV